MASDNEIKALKAVTARKKEYLKYFNRVGAKNAKTWGQWNKETTRAKEVNKMGGSPQLRRGLSGLSDSDYDSVMKIMKGKK